jgi:hypothetical protein
MDRLTVPRDAKRIALTALVAAVGLTLAIALILVLALAS